ncbi:hypothetical protein CDL12_17607 [Handroanthus impetiginosus]|uniref:S1 motif domain-containing protein n=1 Tax=Handroanthus impetiginosus TaxID=429701 RepID=A0A2G9GX16_9LAMI|nr:hypothetical protein CDL12_17607 [Handroanthus impetiginosus]
MESHHPFALTQTPFGTSIPSTSTQTAHKKMLVFTAASVSGGLGFLSHDNIFQNTLIANPPTPLTFPCYSISQGCSSKRAAFLTAPKVSVSSRGSTRTDDGIEQSLVTEDAKLARRAADWKAAKAYQEKGIIYEGKIEGFNGGGLLVKFYSLLGFLPYPQLSPSHACREPDKPIQEIAKALMGTIMPMKVIKADVENRKLIFSEKEANWSKFSPKLNVGDIYDARVGSVEDYGAFVHLRFPDGLYHLTGLVHVSEVSWDLVQDARDILTEGDEVRVKIVNIDREKSRFQLSIKQLEEDPLLETLDKVIPQDVSVYSDALNDSDHFTIEPLPGLEMIIEELLKEDGYGYNLCFSTLILYSDASMFNELILCKG